MVYVTRQNDSVTATELIRVRGWGIVPQSPNCTVLTALDPDTGRYVSAPVALELLDTDERAADSIYDKLERELRWHQEHDPLVTVGRVEGRP